MTATIATPMDRGGSSDSVRQAYHWCKSYTKERAKNFYYAFAPLPGPKRRAIYAVYAFSGYVDDIADELQDADEQREQLSQARTRLDDCYAGRRQGDLFVALGDAIDQFTIPRELFDELINGVEMDFTVRRYATWKDLSLYCYRVASMVGLICVAIFGAKEDPGARTFATDLGIAMQLVNIMRDVEEDAERGRVYFPEDELARFGLTADDILCCRYDERFAAVMRQQALRAHGYFESGRRLLSLLDLPSRMCVNVLQGFYSEILHRIEGRHYDVISSRVSLSGREKLVALAGLWMAAAVAHRR